MKSRRGNLPTTKNAPNDYRRRVGLLTLHNADRRWFFIVQAAWKGFCPFRVGKDAHPTIYPQKNRAYCYALFLFCPIYSAKLSQYGVA